MFATAKQTFVPTNYSTKLSFHFTYKIYIQTLRARQKYINICIDREWMKKTRYSLSGEGWANRKELVGLSIFYNFNASTI